jgi:hypothetical protein
LYALPDSGLIINENDVFTFGVLPLALAFNGRHALDGFVPDRRTALLDQRS